MGNGYALLEIICITSTEKSYYISICIKFSLKCFKGYELYT